jgi:hypothetical protein
VVAVQPEGLETETNLTLSLFGNKRESSYVSRTKTSKTCDSDDYIPVERSEYGSDRDA